MTTIYAPPAELGDPPDFADPQFADENGRIDFDAHYEAEQAWVQTVVDAAKAGCKSDIAGEILRFPVGDGYAQYVVWNTKPFQLIHLAVGDAWSIPEAHARGLRVSDARAQILADKRLADLFSKSA